MTISSVKTKFIMSVNEDGQIVSELWTDEPPIYLMTRDTRSRAQSKALADQVLKVRAAEQGK